MIETMKTRIANLTTNCDYVYEIKEHIDQIKREQGRKQSFDVRSGYVSGDKRFQGQHSELVDLVPNPDRYDPDRVELLLDGMQHALANLTANVNCIDAISDFIVQVYDKHGENCANSALNMFLIGSARLDDEIAEWNMKRRFDLLLPHEIWSGETNG